ncbi:hypothetical protein KFE98_12300 [bacterium SCSIO 12741]|nr:hypothetical protein KFE98_12300 [bacterium SCSIO 12741]
MRQLFLLLFSLFVTVVSLNAQVIGGKQDKLFDMYLLEKYEACYARALKMTETEKYRSDPEPYLYASMCIVKFKEVDPEAFDYYGGLKMALKFGEKAMKYHAKCEKKNIATYALEDNIEFYNELVTIGLEEALYHINEDKFSKGASWLKKVAKVRKDDENIQLALGASMLLSKNAEGQKIIDVVVPQIKEKYKSGDAVPDDITRDALITGFIIYARYLNESGRSSEAQDFITMGKEIFPDNLKITRSYDELVGS